MSASPAREALVSRDAPDAEVTDLAVRRAQAGEVGAFERLYRQHVGRVFAVCRRLAGETALAEELTQDTFVRAWHGLHTYAPGTSFTAWLSRIAVNVCLGERRERARRAQRETTSPDPETKAPTRPAPEAGLDLERAIDRLPDAARIVFVLHDVEGFRHQEIAERLGVSAGTSKSQLHRARRLLKEALCR